MKAAVAKRETTCSYCKEPIVKGAQRMDDVVRLGERVVRFRYHKQCHYDRTELFFKEAAEEALRPKKIEERTDTFKATLSTEDYNYRHKLMARLSALKAYYVPRLNLTTPMEKLTNLEAKRFETYYHRRTAILGELKKVGGIPSSHIREMKAVEEPIPSAFPGSSSSNFVSLGGELAQIR